MTHIIQIAVELAPISKVGGLGDVIYGLSRELVHQNQKVTIILPKHDIIDRRGIKDLRVKTDNFQTFFEGAWHSNTIWEGKVEGVTTLFIDPHHPKHFFNRGCIYGNKDDVDRFLYFSRAAADLVTKLDADILHIHEWHTAAIAPIMRFIYPKEKAKILLTLHNIDYQGKCLPHDLLKVGLKDLDIKDDKEPHLINLLKSGIVYSDFITTVSPTHAKEIITPEGGKGLHNTLLKFQKKLKGILNGLDYDYWNPQNDPYLPTHYSAKMTPAKERDLHIINNKGFLKKALRSRLELDNTHKPIIGSISRLIPQKGIHLIKYAIDFALKNEGQFVLLGSSSIPEISEEFHNLKHTYADHPNVHLFLQHEEQLAHLIFAGSDMFIVPSLFEPCGLTQMIALRYGTIPVVRKTGGLCDTIFDVETSGLTFRKTNGFTFDDPTIESFDTTLTRAFKLWFEDPEKWHKLVMNGMKQDFSWKEPTQEYVKLYLTLRDNKSTVI